MVRRQYAGCIRYTQLHFFLKKAMNFEHQIMQLNMECLPLLYVTW